VSAQAVLPQVVSVPVARRLAVAVQVEPTRVARPPAPGLVPERVPVSPSPQFASPVARAGARGVAASISRHRLPVIGVRASLRVALATRLWELVARLAVRVAAAVVAVLAPVAQTPGVVPAQERVQESPSRVLASSSRAWMAASSWPKAVQRLAWRRKSRLFVYARRGPLRQGRPGTR
jgi:hypothetical protein